MSMIITNMNRMRTSTNPQFGAWLESEMRAAGMNQVELAKKVGVRHPSVGRWIKGRAPDAKYINGIALALDKTYSEVNERAGYAPYESHERLEEIHRDIDGAILKIIDDEHNLRMFKAAVHSFIDGIMFSQPTEPEAPEPEPRDGQESPLRLVRPEGEQ